MFNPACANQRLKFNEVIPGRILHVRVTGEDHCLDVLSYPRTPYRKKGIREVFSAKLNSSSKGV